jgi:hypothetical protein
MKALELKPQIAFKNILFATDLDISARRAFPPPGALVRVPGARHGVRNS